MQSEINPNSEDLISSKLIIFLKLLIPWGLVLGFGIFALFNARAIEPNLLVAGLFSILMFLISKLFISPLSDCVYDCGEYLIVIKGKKKAKIPISDICNIKYRRFSFDLDLKIVTLELENECAMGKIIFFLADDDWTYSAEDLKSRSRE